jgi:hypothetical protein
MFLRPFLLLAALTGPLMAATLDARYDISYAFLPSIGTVTLHYHADKGRYRIEANATLHGLAAVLANHHSEDHVSTGRIGEGGRLIPDRYDTIRTLDGYRREQHYLFNHAGRIVTLHEHTVRTVTSKHFDTQSMHMVTTEKTSTDDRYFIMPYRADNDVLSLYFNARERLSKLQKGAILKLHAAGAGGGLVTIRRDTGQRHFTFFLHQDIFRSSNGEMQVVLGRNLYVKEAVLKDVFLFGDLTVTRNSLKERP